VHNMLLQLAETYLRLSNSKYKIVRDEDLVAIP
jgi:hypothetical protein